MQTLKIAKTSVFMLLAIGIVMALRSSRLEQPSENQIKPPAHMNEFEKPENEPVKTAADVGALGNSSATKTQETAILAGGCFWGMEEILRKIPGVKETTVGYIGGSVANPTYKQVCTGSTGHAEGIEIVFDPAILSYEHLLGYFFRMHDPTTLNQQHNDKGTQYRSAIFYTSDEQKQTVERVKAQVDKSGKFNRPIVTELTAASKFYPGEDYHQKYLVKNPGGYNCHVLRN